MINFIIFWIFKYINYYIFFVINAKKLFFVIMKKKNKIEMIVQNFNDNFLIFILKIIVYMTEHGIIIENYLKYI